MSNLSYKEAKAKGKTRYFTGKPCPYGHISERIVSTRACSECAAERKRLWNKQNPEKVNEQKRNWVNSNPERAKQIKAESQLRNRNSANERNRNYAKANPAKRRANWMRYQASKLQATPKWADFQKIERAYELAQEYRAKGIDAVVDHIIPLRGEIVCGLHVQDNLQVISNKHNCSKSNYFKEI